jgi:hypothetical protein
VIQGEAVVEKSININIEDFYYNTTISTNFTTGSTTGTDVTGDVTSLCGFTVSGRLGHSSGDISEGFRVNNATLFLRISFGSKIFTAISGDVYTTASRSFRITTNTVAGTSSYVSATSSTYTSYSVSPTASVLNTPVSFNKITFSPTFTGEIEIRASGSTGLTNLTLYYND